MKKTITATLISGVVLLLLSIAMTMSSIYLFPSLTEEYFSPVFRMSGNLDWMFYLHPFIVSIALKWFWEKYKTSFTGTLFIRAVDVALVYSIVALIPVLWLTFSAIEVSFSMIATWFFYGFIQAFVAGLIFGKLNP